MAFSATTLTALLRAQVSANIEVPAEPCGVLDGCNLKFDDKGAALGQVVLVPVVVPVASGTATPSNVPPTGTAQTPVNAQVVISATPEQSMTFTGEDLKLLDTIESRDDILKQFVAQAERAHRNAMSTAAAYALRIGASRAVGTAGTTPFKTDMNGFTTARRILRTNGAPMSDIQVATGPYAYENLLRQNVIQKAQEAGSDQERRTGVIRSQFGLSAIREDSNIGDHASGGGTGYILNGTHAKGSTRLTVKSGTVNVTGIQVGDAIKIGSGGGSGTNDTEQYMVGPAPGTVPTLQTATDSDLLAASGYIYIGSPGLQQQHVDGDTITIQSGTTLLGTTGYSPSFVFERHALAGIIRPPIMPIPNPFYTILDTITDKFGYSYLFGEATQQFQVSWFVWVAYGFGVTQREYVVPIIGD